MEKVIPLLLVILAGCAPQDRRTEITVDSTQNAPIATEKKEKKFDVYQNWLWERAEFITLLSIKYGISRDDALKAAWEFYKEHDSLGLLLSSIEKGKMSFSSPEEQTKNAMDTISTINTLSDKYTIDPKVLAAFIADVRLHDKIIDAANQK